MSITRKYLEEQKQISVIVKINKISLVNKFCLELSSFSDKKDHTYIYLYYSNVDEKIIFKCYDPCGKLCIFESNSNSMIDDFLKKISSIGYQIFCYPLIHP